ncbi:MAG: Cof-type HAD-IIB family hydrolase [Mycoplasma sp.]|nr:Cof-type HAD-IIB family hydrolase [Mycoplasma sp.]
MENNDKLLLMLDLDGTLLNTSDGMISKEDKKAIEKFRKLGHIVCLSTGRPWRSTEKIYNELKLDTIVVNFNGAHIHHPKDYYFQQYIASIDVNDGMYVLGDKKLQQITKNVALEGIGWIHIKKRDKVLEEIFGFANVRKFKEGININKLPIKPTNIIIDTIDDITINKMKEIHSYLTRTYGDLVEITYWSKGQDLSPVIDISKLGVSKGKAVSLLSRYYDVLPKNTIAIGDGLNDLTMIKKSEVGVAMANGDSQLKKYATYITTKTNKESGVAEVINKILDDPTFLEEQRKIKEQKLFG